MATSTSQSKVIVGSQTYRCPPEPQALTEDDFYINRARQTVTKHGRKQLESWVCNRIMREVFRLISSRESRQYKKKTKNSANSQQESLFRHIMRWLLWSTETWVTSSIFVPTHYDHNRIPGPQPKRTEYALTGLQIRISESQEVMWRSAQVPVSPDFVLERDAAKAMSWKHRSMVRPLSNKYKRVLATQLSDEILAALWYALHKNPL